jgi:hypothetical protein
MLLVISAAGPLAAQTVINIPPSTPINSAGAGTVVNVLPGGELPGLFQAQNGSTLNILGGSTREIDGRPGAVINVNSGRVAGRIYHVSRVTMTGGRVDQIFNYFDTVGSQTSLSGGAVEMLGALPGTALEIAGVDFAVNGVPVTGLNQVGDLVAVNLPDFAVLTGLLADGTPFAHDQSIFGQDSIISNGTLTLRRSASPTPPAPGELVVTSNSPLAVAGTGQHVRVQSGGRLETQFRSGPGSQVTVEGGRIAEAFHAIGSEVTLESGTIARRFNAYEGAVVDVRGGLLDGDSQFFHNATLNVFGGELGQTTMRSGATANVHGGTLFHFGGARGSQINIYGGQVNQLGSGGEVNVYGGNFGSFYADGPAARLAGGAYPDNVHVGDTTTLVLEGSEFRIDGLPIAGLSSPGESLDVNMSTETRVLSGVFTDGTPFAFSEAEKNLLPASIRLVRGPGHAAGPSTINVPAAVAPFGIHSGQSLVLSPGGTIGENFVAGWGSRLTVHGGDVGGNLQVNGATVAMDGGRIRGGADLYDSAVLIIAGNAEFGGLEIRRGAVVNIGGNARTNGDFQRVHHGGVLNINGGELRGIIQAEGGRVNITGGSYTSLANDSYASRGSRVDVSGGSLSQLRLHEGAQLNATGGSLGSISLSTTTSAVIDGARVQSLSTFGGTQLEIKTGNITNLGVFGTTKLRGGALGDGQDWGGVMEVYGDDFQVDGAPVAGLANPGDSVIFNYQPETLFTGVLSDGTPFAHATNDNFFRSFSTEAGSVRLIRTPAPAPDSEVLVPADAAPLGAVAGQRVIVETGGALGNNFVAGHDSVVEVRGGVVGENFEAERSQVLMTGGTIGPQMDVFRGATVTVSGGTVGEEWAVAPGGRLDVTGGLMGNRGQVLGGVVNVSGGKIGSGFDALDGSVVTMTGGMIDSEFEVFDGGRADIRGGEIGGNLHVEDGGVANVSGGRLRGLEPQDGSTVVVTGGLIDAISPRPGSHVEVRGGAYGDAFENQGATPTLFGLDFEINGAPVAGLGEIGQEATLTVASDQLFTGTLSDGTPFAFTTNESDTMRTVRLVRTADVAGPAVINVPSDAAPLGVRAGQELRLGAGGVLGPHFNAGKGSLVNILDGSVGENFEGYGAAVNIDGGTVGNNFDAFAGSQVHVRGGVVGLNFEAHAQSSVELTDGLMNDLQAGPGSNVQLAGGKVMRLEARGGAQTEWRGGVVSTLTTSGASTRVAIHGVDFKLNGVSVLGLANEGDSISVNLPAESVLTGVLADGTPMVLNGGPFIITNGTLRLTRSGPPGQLGPALQVISTEQAPYAIGAGQTLQLQTGGLLGPGFIAGPGSELSMTGGRIATGFKAVGADVEIRGGTVEPGFTVLEGAEALVSGGTIGNQFSVGFAGKAVITGGAFSQTGFLFRSGSEINVYGRSFTLNGLPMTGLTNPGDSRVVTERSNQLLSAVLADGTSLSWRLTLALEGGRPSLNGIASGATLRLHVIPEPATGVLAVAATLVSASCRRSAGRRFHLGGFVAAR